MHHDPLCPCADIEWASCFRTSAENDRCVSCRCYLIVKRIAEERADEREKAAQRVETQRSSFRARDWDDAIAAAAAAARGEA